MYYLQRDLNGGDFRQANQPVGDVTCDCDHLPQVLPRGDEFKARVARSDIFFFHKKLGTWVSVKSDF